MSIQHHLSDDILLDYAAGGLAEGWSLAAATHIALCPVCRARAAALDAIGGAALEDLTPAPISDDALDACLRLLDAMEADPAPSAAPAGPGLLPTPLRAFVGGDVDVVAWRRVGGGVRQAPLGVRGGAKARLLYIPAGVAVPEHGHGGLEMTVVLTGSFLDKADVFAAGDIQVCDGAVDHQPISGDDGPCICLAVTDAPLRFRRLVPRIAQRIAGL